MVTKSPLLNRFREKPLETGIEVISDAATPLAKEFRQEASIALNQLVGFSEQAHQTPTKMEGELHEGEEISFANEKPETNSRIQAAMNYGVEIIHATQTVRTEEKNEQKGRIEEVRAQIIQHADSSTQIEVQTIAVESHSQQAGVYHETRYERIRNFIFGDPKDPSEKLGSKVAKKRGFWDLAKQYGTQFSLGSERAVAQQVG